MTTETNQTPVNKPTAPLADTVVKPLTRRRRTSRPVRAATPKLNLQLKPLAEQVIVITGASSGIGLVTARMAAQRGARVVLAARSAEAIQELADELNSAADSQADLENQANAETNGQGGANQATPNRQTQRALAVTADVSRAEEVQRVAAQAQETFGRVDTWVNNAGVSIYGPITEVPTDEHRQIFETNYWGVVHGSLEAVKQMRANGGALINVGSVLSDRAIPLQGHYCASKHAVKGFTDALRMELEREGVPMSVTLIKPSAIDTPYKEHAKNYLDKEPNNPPPVYAPETVAEAILYAAQTPTRDLVIGGGGRMITTLAHFAPRLMDKIMEKVMFSAQHSTHPARVKGSGLYEGSGTLNERGNYEGHVAESSLYTQAAVRPWVVGGALLGAGLAWAAWRRRR